MFLNPEFNKNFKGGEDDLAVVLLKSPAPVSVPKIKFAHMYSAYSQGSKFVVGGYGKVKEYNEEEERDYFLRFVNLNPAESVLGHPSFIKPTNPILYFDQKDRQGACIGDSGGPVYVQVHEQWYLTGIVSSVFNVNNRNEACTGTSLVINLVAQKPWLSLVFGKIDPKLRAAINELN